MSYVRFMNGPNPIWDFISEMGGNQEQTPFDRRQRGPPRGAWGWSPFDQEAEHGPWAREMPHRPHRPHSAHAHRGRGGPRGHHPPHHHPADQADDRSATLQAEDDPINLVDNAEETPAPDPEISTPADEPMTSDDERDQHEHPHSFGHGYGYGFGRRGGFGHHGRGGMRGPRGHGGPWAFPHRHHPYARHCRRRGSGPPGAADAHPLAPFANMFGVDLANFDPERLREAFADALQTAASTVHPGAARGTNGNSAAESDGKREPVSKDIDFRPAADIYDAAEEYVVHFALPGAKKEDISLNWDAEKSELYVSGLIAREGDEETMKTLALDERDVGVFERKVKLGREGVDADGITAKMENGLLVVRVPKKLEDEWTEVRKVDIE